MQRTPSMTVRLSAGASAVAWGHGADFNSTTACTTGLAGLYATLGREPVDTTDDSALEHVCTVADAGTVRCHGRHGHAVLFGPEQTADPRFVATDAAVMMNGSANARFSRDIRRRNRGVRTSDDDGTVCF
jgi:hypothetical protein